MERGAHSPAARRLAACRESPAPPHPGGAAPNPRIAASYPAAYGTLRFAPAAGPKQAPARSPTRQSAPSAPAPSSAFAGGASDREPGAGASPSSVRGGAGKARGGGGRLRRRGRSAWNPRRLWSGLGMGQVESPLLVFPGSVAKA